LDLRYQYRKLRSKGPVWAVVERVVERAIERAMTPDP